MDAVDFSKEPDESKVYPALHHFKVITDAATVREELLLAVLEGFDVRSPLTRGHASKGGKYVTYDVSIHFPDRATHHKFHAAMKAAPSVKILL